MIQITEIQKFLDNMESVSSTKIKGSGDSSRAIMIEISLHELKEKLAFTVIFDPWYPSKVCGSESIHFYNKDLLAYPHIMENGSLCLHTISSSDWKEKLLSDINQLCEWIRKYYINHEQDEHFEHIVVNESTIDDCYYYYNYAQTSLPFYKGEYGYVSYLKMIDGQKHGKTIKNFLTISYSSKNFLGQETKHTCPFSEAYTNTSDCDVAPYIVLNTIPARYKKFIYNNYMDFEEVITQIHRKHIFSYAQTRKSNKGLCQTFPLYIGYHMPDGNMSWNVAMINSNNLPTVGVPEYINNHKSGNWHSQFIDQPILWAMTNDISPDLFYGRGCFPKEITNKRILIMGVGAIGSIVAKTLVRGGCKEITLYDFDIKYPGNICRSEYDFICPSNDKAQDLATQLQRISPYVNITLFKEDFDGYVKVASQQTSAIKTSIGNAFKQSFDLVIDCTTDDDVMYSLEQLQLPIDIINISISNHANELVCAFSPSIYEFVRGVYRYMIKNDPFDVFYPTGCWNPTFKANYNDIASKLHYALKKVVDMLIGKINKQNFIITEEQEGLRLRLW